MSVQPTLAVRALSKTYRRRPVLRDVSFELRPGDAVAILGPNGAGKSTLLGCITGERLPDGGEIRVCGADPFSDPSTAARCMGFVPEQPFLYGELTVGEMIGFVVEARRLGAEGREEAERLLALLDMAGTQALLCRELSQGMGRKVAIVAGLLHRPRLLVLDEAFNGLDRTSVERLTAELDARRADGAGVLLSSHDLDFLASWCDRGLALAPGAGARTLAGQAWDRWRASPALRFEGSTRSS
ncbi:MAG TPA: ABC transporter ATP-binding protein [Longimicrobiaceae bacterium]|nr:ABC transporter ATP-binding protein [Longimicrobiaceae bacterium]